MYNYYLDQVPIDVTPEPVREPSREKVSAPAHNSSLLSLLSHLGQKNGLNDLLSGENLIVLAAIAFLSYGDESLDSELFALAVLFLLIGL